ncbi:MAG: hypothetical protein QOH27_1196, partial [Mycobacterium sp.]|nr:hypothetical protein [Mycobacterium sp.]
MSTVERQDQPAESTNQSVDYGQYLVVAVLALVGGFLVAQGLRASWR